MARELPIHPDLGHLKKEAKTLLRDVRRGAAGAAERFRQTRRSPPRLSDALHVLALEYGFAAWPALKKHVQSATGVDPMRLAHTAFERDDARALRRLLRLHPDLKAKINEPVAAFDAPAVIHVRSRAMLDVLLEAGADINARSRWWAGGFGLLDQASPALAAYAVSQGARLDVHAAARLGLKAELARLIEDDPERVHARGGDGQTPLHFAATAEIAELLLERGAEIDARDLDHDSTPAQYMVRSRQDVARFLVRRGCATDLLLAAALGDVELARHHLASDPACIRLRVSDEYYPMAGGKTGGTIYQWELGWYVSARQVALTFGHGQMYRYLMEESPPDERLLDACWLGDEREVESLLGADPDTAATMAPPSRRHVAHAARNNDLRAILLMLKAGLPMDGTGQHGATPLHWAAFHGNAEMADRILAFGPPLEVTDDDFKSTPLGWAIHGSEHGWERARGDYPGVVEGLLNAGAKPPPEIGGSEAVRRVLRRRRQAGPG